MSILVLRRGWVAEHANRGAIIAAAPVDRDASGETQFLVDPSAAPVIVLGTSHWGKKVTVLTSTGDHVDIDRQGFERWLIFGQAQRPYRKAVRYHDTYWLPNVQPGDRFVHATAYSGPSSNFRLDVICEITRVDDEHVWYRQAQRPGDDSTRPRYEHRVDRIGFGTAWCHPDDHAVGAWLPRADEPWPFSNTWATEAVSAA